VLLHHGPKEVYIELALGSVDVSLLSLWLDETITSSSDNNETSTVPSLYK